MPVGACIRLARAALGLAHWALLPALAWPQTISEFPAANQGPLIQGRDGHLYFVGATTVVDGTTITDVSFNNPNLCRTAIQASSPSVIAYGPDGKLWSAGICPGGVGGNPPPYSAVVSNTTGAVLVASLPTDMIAGPDGNIWFAGGTTIGKVTPDFAVTLFQLPLVDNQNNGHAVSIASGPDGNIWFTDDGYGKLGRITTDGMITEFDLLSSARSPSYITEGPDGNLWFGESGSSMSYIARATTSGSLTEYAVAAPYVGRIVQGPDGNLWFTEPGVLTEAKLGRITTGGVITEFATPTQNSGPTGIAPGPDGNIWFTEPLVGQGQIGRVNVNCSSTGLCLNSDRFVITATFQTTPEGPSAAASAVPLTNDTGYFWFFDPSNIEVVVKVLTGCTVNGDYWVFVGGLTDVGVQLKVTDSVTGASKSYPNTVGTPFQPIQDSAAFPCP